MDTANNQVTVAVLTTAAAHDPGWRRAFAATANAMAQSGQVSIIAGDYSGAIPWIASAARDGAVLAQVYTALGLDYQPATGSAAPVPSEEVTEHLRTEPVARQTSGPPEPVAAATSPAPWAAPPADPPSSSYQPTHRPHEPGPAMSPHTVSPFSMPPADPPPRRRTGLLVGVTVLVVALLVGGGSLAAVALWPEDGGTTTPPTDPPVREPTFPPAAAPGIEPPADGEWPAEWPVFAEDEPVDQVTEVIGDLFGQSFEVPQGWECPSVATEGTFAHYTCGPEGDAAEIGGDITIRFCPDPCDEDRRSQMRGEVEAWGLPWIQDFGFRSWAETDEVDGEQRYGLVFVAYYRTAPEGRIDRQLVLRMTAPTDQADEIRKVANSVREAVR